MCAMSNLVIVTGGSSGIGRALLANAPEASHRIDVSRSGATEVVDEHVPADLSDPAQWAAVAATLTARIVERSWERITVVQSAGTLEPIGFVGEVDAEAYTRNVLINAAAVQVLGHHVLAALRRVDTRAELALVSSGAARTPYPGWSSYGAAKAAVDQWVRTVGAEQEQRGGVRVLSVAPGVVATPMQEAIRATDETDFPNVARFHQLHEDGDLIDADVAARAFWSLLDDRSVTTGSVTDLRDRF